MAYLIVSLFDEEEEEIREVVVPDFWFCDGFCRMPLKGLDAKSESKEMFKASWPSFEVKVLSKHKTYAAAQDRKLAGAVESESGPAHIASLNGPRQRTMVIPETEDSQEMPQRPLPKNRVAASRGEQPVIEASNGSCDLQVTKKRVAVSDIAPPTKLQKRIAEIRPFVQEVEFSGEATPEVVDEIELEEAENEEGQEDFTPLPFYEAETQKAHLKLYDSADEESDIEWASDAEEKKEQPKPASPATVRRFISLHRSPPANNTSSSIPAGPSTSLVGVSAAPPKASTSFAGPKTSTPSTRTSTSVAGPSTVKFPPNAEPATTSSSTRPVTSSARPSTSSAGTLLFSARPSTTTVQPSTSAARPSSTLYQRHKKLFAESSAPPSAESSQGHGQTQNYLRAVGRIVIGMREEFNQRLDNVLQRISSASFTNPEMHPSFQAAQYNMPLPDPAAFFDFELKLKNDPAIRQNLIAAIRGFGGKDYKDAMKIAWKECATDSLLAQGTWTGQTKSGTNKDRSLKFLDSELEKTINNAIKFGPINGEVTVTDLQVVSQNWVLKAKERLGKTIIPTNPASSGSATATVTLASTAAASSTASKQ